MEKRAEKTTIVDVARTAGVSVGTVSRVLNGNTKVRAQLRQKVQAAIDELGYAPNAVAQSMRRRSTHTVGCVIREINLPPLAAFVLFGSLSRMPTDTEDAARIDGAGVLGTLARVTVPALWPSIAATAVVVFVLAWNSLLVPLLLTDGHVKMIPVAMSDFFTFERELEWPTAAAALIVSFLPLAALVMASQSVLDRFTLHERSRT